MYAWAKMATVIRKEQRNELNAFKLEEKTIKNFLWETEWRKRGKKNNVGNRMGVAKEEKTVCGSLERQHINSQARWVKRVGCFICTLN